MTTDLQIQSGLGWAWATPPEGQKYLSRTHFGVLIQFQDLERQAIRERHKDPWNFVLGEVRKEIAISLRLAQSHRRMLILLHLLYHGIPIMGFICLCNLIWSIALAQYATGVIQGLYLGFLGVLTYPLGRSLEFSKTVAQDHREKLLAQQEYAASMELALVDPHLARDLYEQQIHDLRRVSQMIKG